MSLWGDSAINAFVNLTPSSPWALRVAEQWKGLPFGKYLQQSPPARKRALTGPHEPVSDSVWQRLPLFSSPKPEKRPYEQPWSLFLSRLPLDVRIIVYEMIIGGMHFHIESGTPQSRIFHIVCSRPEAIGEPNHLCHDLSSQRPSSAPRDDYKEASGLLPLLVTCRKVYSECIHILYSANTFQFTSNHAAFRLLKTMVPLHRLQSIRHFRMTMRVPHHPHMNTRSKRDWTALWDFFANVMPGLQSLHLKLLLLHDTQQQIIAADDIDGSCWIAPMITMANKAGHARDCKVEIVTGLETQDLSSVYKTAAKQLPVATDREVLQSACAVVHSRIRLSLGG
ncbi:hypothetical protein LTR62_003154 [Meristemomyces frigidus]|uniref:DUF7730 domain-containing protein n=1 Tax=Meristemomyces frigidus TaxID=1508187 RepID=A0AAN7TL19_9PEZI|nr:hypothetical protein LTR62_003154 [Meristemomyces frigidus]